MTTEITKPGMTGGAAADLARAALAHRMGVAAKTPEGADKLKRIAAEICEMFAAGYSIWRPPANDRNAINPWSKLDPGDIEAAALLAYDLDLAASGPWCGFYAFPQGDALQFRITPRGYQTLALRAGQRVKLREVREGDAFGHEITSEGERFFHRPIPFSTKPIIGAYCAVYRVTDEALLRVITLSKAELDVRASASKSGIWGKYYAEMAKKSVLHRAIAEMAIVLSPQEAERVREMPIAGVAGDNESPVFDVPGEAPAQISVSAPEAPRAFQRPPAPPAPPQEETTDPVSGEQA